MEEIKGVLLVAGKTVLGNVYTKEMIKETVEKSKDKLIPFYVGYNDNGQSKDKIGDATIFFENGLLMCKGKISDLDISKQIKKGDSIGVTLQVDFKQDEVGEMKVQSINYCDQQKMAQEEMKITEVKKC